MDSSGKPLANPENNDKNEKVMYFYHFANGVVMYYPTRIVDMIVC